MKRRVAVIGGGAAGASLLWCLTDQEAPRSAIDATLFHDEDEIGGHSRTISVAFDASGKGHVTETGAKGSHPVDIGVQFVCNTLYPNLYRQLQRPEFSSVRLTRHPALRMSGAFGDDLVWGNFPEYQSSRFRKCLDDTTMREAERFQRDLNRAPFARIGERKVWEMSVGDYLAAAGIARDGNFFRYLLIPYLCIINGYGTVDLLETTMQDLFPIFTRLPLVQPAGPYGSFTEPGLGWDRFTDGATSWVKAMSDLGEARGAKVRLAAQVRKVRRRGREWIVEWTSGATYGKGGVPLAPGSDAHEEAFDEVVFTTDMTTNVALLDHDENPHREAHRVYLSGDRFRLLPGVCYIHQDESLLAENLRDGKEDGQFTGTFAWGKTDEGSRFYDLPYDLGAAFQTYFMDNILGTPAPCYVSMYAEDRAAQVPAPDKTIFRRTWRHGRWVASFFRQGKRELHRVQGLGNLWFAGNNTTIDSEEGALLSAMIIAAHFAGYRYPFERGSLAWVMHGWFHEQMFPASSLRAQLTRLATGTVRPARLDE
ncbi:MAG: NAD(P)-binding protein [Polyangiales bacterium]